MITQDFAETGFFAQRPSDHRITRFQVLGERSSGTNFVKRLIGKNTALTPTEDLGWKHGFSQMIGIPHDLAVIVSVRRADRWALSMHAKPWHTTPALQKLTFSDFIQSPWDTIVDRPRYFGGRAAALPIVGAPLQQDRHPITGATFGNLFQLRKAKLAHHLGYAQRGCTFVLVRMETAQAEPDLILDRLRNALGLAPATGPLQAVTKRLGSKFKAAVPERPVTPQAASAADIAFLRAETDPGQEAMLGYSYE